LTGHAVRRVVGLVLTPHGSSRGSEEYLARAQVALGEECRFVAVPPWYSEPDLVALLAGRVSDALATASAGDDPRRYPVIFTAHSLPEQAAGGDGDGARSYPAQLAESARLVAAAAGVDRWQVAWQSAGRTPEPWLGPDVRDMVRRLAESGGANGAHGVVVCPIGFVADHLEVLYDLDIELADVAAQVGLSYARTASLNDDPRFVEVLADIAAAAAHGG
jgi:ferrochelatase